MSAIQSRPTIVDAQTLFARSPTAGSPKPPMKVKLYWPAMYARFAITMMSAMMMPQPPIQPVIAPNARVAQRNVVPQSGSASFSSLYACAMKYIGMKARMTMAGAFTPARIAPPPVATMKPRLAARL